jgi:hypothetical protein
LHRPHRTAISARLAVLLVLSGLVPALAPCAGAAPRKGPATFDPTLRIERSASLDVPPPGAWDMRMVSPTVIEIDWINSAPKGGNPLTWDFVKGNQAILPPPSAFEVRAGGAIVAVQAVGFRRRPTFAPKSRRDLRIGNALYLRLASPVPENAEVRVRNPSADIWTGADALVARMDPLRWSAAIHVAHVGYAVGSAKRAAVGTWMGSLGELPVGEGTPFRIVDAGTGQVAFSGRLVHTTEDGFENEILPNQQIREADFTQLDRPGSYRLVVPGLGASAQFRIDPGLPALLARTLALGLLHQRCGFALDLPFTRFVHKTCHMAPAMVPAPDDARFNDRLSGLQEGKSREDQAAPLLDSVRNALFPYSRPGPVDVHGGHHDAGDYGKYVTNSAALVHALVLAVDAFPGVADLDNLGLPESGDGRPDILQIATWEADFLARMQDDDGGFYFLVHPQNRPYEDDVMPDRGDPQVVLPKNTSATAAAVAALAQAGSSPRMRSDFPTQAADYLARALKGWGFLEAAWGRHGRKASYQRVTHYGDQFEDSDEIAWAAMELWLATGQERFAEEARRGFDPLDHRRTRRWEWVPLTEGYGNATRSCALAPRTGHPFAARLDKDLQQRCRKELDAVGDELASWALASAYRTSFPTENKRFRTAAWYFSPENAFDLEVAGVGRNRPDLQAVAASNFDYALGANPVDVSFVAGLGRNRPRNIVSQFALNDHRALPPTGLLVGDVTAGPAWTPEYQHDLSRLAFPPDGDKETRAPYPMYDRWTDAWNVQTEATVVPQGRALAAAAAWMARTPLKNQAWRSVAATIVLPETRVRADSPVHPRLKVDGMDLATAQIAWEASGLEPDDGPNPVFVFPRAGAHWLEAEATWPDGRRAFAHLDVTVDAAPQRQP